MREDFQMHATDHSMWPCQIVTGQQGERLDRGIEHSTFVSGCCTRATFSLQPWSDRKIDKHHCVETNEEDSGAAALHLTVASWCSYVSQHEREAFEIASIPKKWI